MLPLSKPLRGVDGKLMNEIFVPQGTTLIVAIPGSNRNKDLWGDDAYEWKPERWLSPLPDAVTSAPLPSIYSHL